MLLVGKPAGLKPTRLTDSGVYYLPLGRPKGTHGAGAVDLHVADGSQVVSQLGQLSSTLFRTMSTMSTRPRVPHCGQYWGCSG